MCSKITKLRYLLAMPILLLGTLLTAQNAFAVQASGSVSIIPSDNTLAKDQVFTAVIRVTNTSSETGDEGTDPVDAVYVAGGATTITLACTTSACITELPGTLEFQPQGVNGCVASNAGVNQLAGMGCVASGNNAVIINIASDIAISTFVNLATIQLKAKTPVLIPQNGSFAQRAETGLDDLRAESAVNPELAPVTGGAVGSTSYLFPGACSVQVDKQISCDGGLTWVDEGLGSNNDDGTNGCSTANPNPVMVRYQAVNTGDFDVSQCTFSETNPAFGAAPIQSGLAVGGLSDLLPGTLTPSCSSASVNEPDTVTFTCGQCGNGTRPAPTPASDTATFSCQSVDVRTDRAVSCNGDPYADETLVQSNEDGTNGCTTLDGNPVNWTYQARNNGDANLYDCTLVDANSAVSPNPIVVGDIAANTTVSNIPATNTIQCSDDLETAEAPDGGRVDLTCCTVNVAGIADCADTQKVTANDVSTVTCNSPDLNVSKLCEDTDGDRVDEITITAQNTGEVPLVDCHPTDTIYYDDLTCPPVGTGTVLNSATNILPDPFNLAASGSQDVTGTVGPLDTDACNTASVTCTIEGTQQTITRDANAVCPGRPQQEGCLTRTPGFWGTHPAITAEYLDISVCGTTIDNVTAGNGNSAIEAICSVGKDGKILGSQLTQLVRQCTAASLNVAASQALGGDCTAPTDFPYIDELLTDCCGAQSVCTGDTIPDRSVSYCIGELDAFNNTPNDTLNFPFKTGPADPSVCQSSKNNGTVVSPTP